MQGSRVLVALVGLSVTALVGCEFPVEGAGSGGRAPNRWISGFGIGASGRSGRFPSR